MKRRVLLLAVLMLAGRASLAHADTITFEDLAVAAGVNSIGGDRTSNGYFFDAVTNHTHLANGVFGADNGTTYLVVDDFNGESPLTFSQVGGGAFSLAQLDLSEWEGDSNYARTVAITGFFSGGGSIATTVTLDGSYDTTGPLVDFQTFVLGGAWTDLTSVTLKGAGSGSGGDYFAVDNIVVDVPEPATLTMLGLGLGAMIGRARRRRTSV